MSQRTKPRAFNRPANQRQALLRSLARSLIIHETVSTTEAKAKSLRPYIERLVTYGKRDTLATRRHAKARLGDDEAVKKLFDSIAPRYTNRAGGYTRVVKRSRRGASDARKLAYIAFV